MTPEQKQKLALIDRVRALTEEADRLPRSPASFARWEEIDDELLQLFREIASLSSGSHPYWFDEPDDKEDQGQ